MKIDLTRIASCYLSDISPDNNIIDEAIATIEAVFENKTDEELYSRERPLMVAYLALHIAKAGLNIYPQNKTHAHWIINSDGYYPYCSNCKAEPKNGKMTKFCAECGAIMDEDGE